MPGIPSVLLSTLGAFRYPLIFLFAIIEGPILMTASGFLLRLGYFEFIPLYGALVLGDFTADVFWYGVGYYGGHHFIKRWGKYFSLTEELVEKISVKFQKHQNKILFFSKITMGLGFALVTLFAAGLSRVSFRNYVFFNFVGGFIWTGLLLGLGYSLGHLYTFINSGLRILFIGAAVILLLAALYGMNRYFRNRATHNDL